ncbi:hypothetical protein GLAREA_04022 [Glarea lozoyensis ATCC 20868]|uniref:Uncharacterized protein n=1 Tax=Glarea lozoyensis (strain ATCC 20868 / MF5171) TaxID=1116229 RepID=S3CZK6_GLAL2|nr:uncharacterized protein GLAREA_04022 [Glarea lozoyensis ATCC 20868]EPE31055.1 hypothetical protein GLAREA_04022 [Glarea lozoyensis ATCC 20868]
MRVSLELAESRSDNLLFKATAFLALLFALSIVTSSGLTPVNNDSNVPDRKSKIPKTNSSALTIHNKTDHSWPIDDLSLLDPPTLKIIPLSTSYSDDLSHSSANPPLTTPDPTTSQAADKNKAIYYQNCRDAELSARKKVEKVGRRLGLFVVGIGGWWWLSAFGEFQYLYAREWGPFNPMVEICEDMELEGWSVML